MGKPQTWGEFEEIFDILTLQTHTLDDSAKLPHLPLIVTAPQSWFRRHKTSQKFVWLKAFAHCMQLFCASNSHEKYFYNCHKCHAVIKRTFYFSDWGWLSEFSYCQQTHQLIPMVAIACPSSTTTSLTSSYLCLLAPSVEKRDVNQAVRTVPQTS